VPKNKRVYRGFDASGEWDIPKSDPGWGLNESARNQIQNNDRLFNLALPEARQFLTNFISAKIRSGVWSVLFSERLQHRPATVLAGG
jgi:hypothetical protein